MANTTLSLRDLLETLPQELYDEIYKATMAVLKEDSSPPLSKGFIVDKEFLPPKLIQINHQTRLEFGEIYYGNTKFTISCDKLGYKFLKSLDLVKQDSFPLRLVVTGRLIGVEIPL